MDVWVNFTNATKWQAEGIFKCFFPSKQSANNNKQANASAGSENLPGSKRKAAKYAVPLLDEEEINELAKQFAENIPENEMSVCTFLFCLMGVGICQLTNCIYFLGRKFAGVSP